MWFSDERGGSHDSDALGYSAYHMWVDMLAKREPIASLFSHKVSFLTRAQHVFFSGHDACTDE